MDYRLFKLAEYLHGWMEYYGISGLYRAKPELYQWLRRRVRMCYLKPWRYCRTKVRELTKLGTFLRTAISLGLSRKGPWRLSRTLATQSGMTNQWLKNQGLLSIKDLWVKIHYPATARAHGNRQVRTRLLGGVGAETPPATRLYYFSVSVNFVSQF
nr:group II intron maturase-specific domain-containing protein [Desulfogranum japonicum]